jgi:hypothetical protein
MEQDVALRKRPAMRARDERAARRPLVREEYSWQDFQSRSCAAASRAAPRNEPTLLLLPTREWRKVSRPSRFACRSGAR